MGIPFAPRSPDVPLHPSPPEINEWHQQAYGVPFMSPEDDEEDEEYFDDREQFASPPHQGDPGQSSSYPSPQVLTSLLLACTQLFYRQEKHRSYEYKNVKHSGFKIYIIWCAPSAWKQRQYSFYNS
jgi:hypothetical protein